MLAGFDTEQKSSRSRIELNTATACFILKSMLYYGCSLHDRVMKVPLGDPAESVSKEKKMDHEPLAGCSSTAAADDFSAWCLAALERGRALCADQYIAVWFDRKGQLVVEECPTPVAAVLSAPDDCRFWLVFDGVSHELLRERSHTDELFASSSACEAFITACIRPVLTRVSG